MDGVHVDALSRWIALRLSRRSFLGALTALAMVAGHEPSSLVAKRQKSRSGKAAAARRRDRRKRRFDALLASTAPEVQREIVGGSAVSQGTNPFISFVQVDLGNNQATVCTGSLITPRHVLTAAHCVVDDANQPFLPGQFLTAVGRALIQNVPAANIWEVTAVFPHPDYDPDTIRNDVAVLQLEGDVPTDIAQPVALVGSNDTRFESPGQMATVAGWGRTSGGGPASAQLMQAPLTVVSDASCAQVIEMEPDVQVCARNMSATACQGDSGGPLLVMIAAASESGRSVLASGGTVNAEKKKGKKRRKRKKGQNTTPVPPPPASPPPPPLPPPPAGVPLQVGVVSFGFQTCPLGGVNVFAQLSAPEVRSFITHVAGV